MKNQPINLTIPAGARHITIGFSETVEEGDDNVRAAFEQAEKQGVASIPLTERDDVRKATGLDILRLRGTPIEMIYSALAAGDIEGANAMFRTSVLEYVYEKIVTVGWAASFINSRNLQRSDEDKLGKVIEGNNIMAIGLTPEFDSVIGTNKVFAPVCKVESGQRLLQSIDDSGIASVMGVIENISDTISAEISQGISNAKLNEYSIPQINLVVDLSRINVAREGETGIKAEASIPALAYATIAN